MLSLVFYLMQKGERCLPSILFDEPFRRHQHPCKLSHVLMCFIFSNMEFLGSLLSNKLQLCIQNTRVDQLLYIESTVPLIFYVPNLHLVDSDKGVLYQKYFQNECNYWKQGNVNHAYTSTCVQTIRHHLSTCSNFFLMPYDISFHSTGLYFLNL